jgi:hypothetical protein
VTDSTNPDPTQRYDLEPEPGLTEGERGELRGRRTGAFSALATARRALRRASPREVAGILDTLRGPDDLAGVLRQLEDLADRSVQGGEW